MKKLLIFLIGILLFASCQDDAIIKDIPVLKNGRYPYYYLVKGDFEKEINIGSLENGFDSLEIRIHYGVALLYKAQMIVIQKNKSDWNAKLYDLDYNYSEANDSLASISKKISSIYPHSGWHNLIKKLWNLDFFTLKDESQIQGYNECNDGYGITVEIATKERYRIYHYDCFNSQSPDILQAKKIELILKTLEKEFDFHRVSLDLDK